MPYTTNGKNAMLNALGVTHASLHDGDPGQTGASEITGGAYARKSITLAAAAAGSVDSTNAPIFDVPAGITVRYVGFWNAATSGTFLASSAVTNEVFSNSGTYTLADADFDLNAA